VGATDETVRLLVPEDDIANPELSIVIPALNEEKTIEEFLSWCQEGVRRAGVVAEILIIDSSTDRTGELALAAGARVLKTPRRGLGRAYIDALPFIRGEYVLMGDADCTYDFRYIGPFLEKLREGFEFVMGSRFRGSIEPGAMPIHHRYFGMPVTTWILNLLFSSRFSDIHCGMRALTREALQRMDLSSDGWEYASEMILKALHLDLRVAEVAVRFFKDRHGRVSNVKRGGWLTPWRAGWSSLRIMFIYGSDFFLYGPGLVLATAGLAAMAVLTFGPVRIGSFALTLHSQFLATALAIIGISSTYMGVVAKVANDLTGEETARWVLRLRYNKMFVLSAFLVVLGLIPDVLFLIAYVRNGLAVTAADTRISHMATTGLFLIIVGFFTFTATLVVHAVAARTQRR
jgi:hypothetical protein